MNAALPERHVVHGWPAGRALSVWATATAAAACGLWAIQPARAQPSRPASHPAVSSLPAERRPQPMPISTAASVEEALAFTDDEKEILKDVHDRDGQWDTPALYVLLRRAEMLPDSRRTLEEAEQPNPKSFWTEPQRYRARLVRATGRLYGPVEELSERIPWTRRWGRRPVHVLYLKVANAAEPVLVYLTRRPPENPPSRMRIAGLFYKLITRGERAETGDPSKTHVYPIIVAKTIYGLRSGGGLPKETALMLAIVLAMLVTFLLLRRYATRRPAPAEGKKHRITRFDDDAGRPPPGPEQQAPDEVDAELRRQVEAYRRQRRDEPEGKDAQDTNHPR